MMAKKKRSNKTGEGMSGNRNKNITKQRILVVKELRYSSGKKWDYKKWKSEP